jgi:hypothetical protein
MKKKNIYILIVLAVLGIIGFIIWWLNTSQKDINPEHVRLNFIIYHENPIADNENFIRNDFLKPLLQSKVISNANGTEELMISSVEVRGLKFCIPAQGINILRYDEKKPLNQTNYTSTSRVSDEDSFFESWEGGEKFDKIISMLKSVDTKLKLPSSNSILNQQKSRFVDSLIVCIECTEDIVKMYSPFVYKNSMQLRKFVNKQIEDFQNAIDDKGVNNSIKVFIYKNLNSQVPKDTDGDGVPDNNDGCPEEKGKKDLKGCPDDDGDRVPNNVDQCPQEKGDPSRSGCPFIEPCPTGDKDKDGVCDDKDNCPNDFGQKKYGGCPPDRDSDGIWDKFDECPASPGPRETGGCPYTNPTVRISKISPEENRFNFNISGKTKTTDELSIRVLKASNSRTLDAFTLNNEQKRAKQFVISGTRMKNLLPKALNIEVKFQFYLNGKLIGNSESYTILCNLP